MRAQKPSGLSRASVRNCSSSVSDLMCACAENSGGGGKTRSSCSTDSMFVVTVDTAPHCIFAFGFCLALPACVPPNARRHNRDTSEMKLYVGTSGYSYKEWKGSFYPEQIPAAEMLSYYASRLPAVELNNTFYRLPQRTMVESWKTQVPKDFRFSVKAPQRITHFKRWKEAGEETKYMLDTVSALEDRLPLSNV